MAFQAGGEIKQESSGFQQGGEIEQQLSQPTDPNQPNIDELLKGLGGKLPVTELPRETKLTRFGGEITNIPNPAFSQEVARRESFNQLLREGHTPEQLDLTLKTQKKIDAIPIGRTVGGIAGGLAALAIPGPADDVAIAALIAGAGAGLGGAAGEAAQVGIEEKRLLSRREALKAFGTEAAFEIGGRAAVVGGKALFSPIIKKIVPEAAALVDDFAKVGGHFSPTELDNRFTLRVGEGFARGGFGAEKIFREFEEKQGKASLAFADTIIDSISEGIARQGPEEIGQAFADGITRPGGRVLNILDDLVDPLYKQIDAISEGATVSTKGLKQFAKKHLATDKRLNGQFLSPTGKAKLAGIIGLGDDLSFSDMRTLRSTFLKDARKLARDVDQSQGIIKQLAGVTDDALFDPSAANGLSEEGLNLLRNTNSLYKAAQEGIRTTFPESLAKRLIKNPSSVAKEVFPNKNPKSIRALRESLLNPIAGKSNTEGKIVWDQLRQTWLADAVDQATKEGVVKPKVYDNIIRKLGPESFKEMFPDSTQRASVRKIQALFSQAGKKPPGGFSLFARGAQAFGLTKMYTGSKEGDFVGFTTGAALAMGPLAFARLATDPRGVKLLTAGMKLKPGASSMVPITARMVKILKDEDKKLERSQKVGESLRTKPLTLDDLSNVGQGL